MKYLAMCYIIVGRRLVAVEKILYYNSTKEVVSDAKNWSCQLNWLLHFYLFTFSLLP